MAECTTQADISFTKRRLEGVLSIGIEGLQSTAVSLHDCRPRSAFRGRSHRSQSAAELATLDCVIAGLRHRFAPRNDEKHTSSSPRRDFARAGAISFAPCIERAQGKPGADCARIAVCKECYGNTHTDLTGTARTSRLSPRNGFTAYT